MMRGTVYVECPCCGARLEVQREDGKVVQHSEKSRKKDGGEDLLKTASERLKAEKERRDKYLANAKEFLDDKKRKVQEQFDREKERIQREGDTARPPNPFDLD